MENKIKTKKLMTIWIRSFDKKNFQEPHLLRADRIEYIADKRGKYFDHHLFFYLGKFLVFKVWLPNEPTDKSYKNINDALKSVKIKVIK